MANIIAQGGLNAQTLALTADQYTILAEAETAGALVVGGTQNAPTIRRLTLDTRVQALDLRIDIAQIQQRGLPLLANFAIRSITINARRYTDIIELSRVWQEYYAENQPLEAAQIARTQTQGQGLPRYISSDDRELLVSRYQVRAEDILVPGTTQTLAQLTPPAPQAATITLPGEIVLPVQPLFTQEGELNLTVVDVDIQAQNLITTYADSTQRITALPVPPLADSATTSGFAATSALADVAQNLAGGNSSTGLGSIPYQSALDTTLLLAPNTTTQRRFLMQQGSGTIGAAPQWTQITAADLGVGVVVADVKGSVVADDSSLMVDGVSGQIVGPIQSPSATVGTLSVTSTATGITAAMVGLGNVTNESKATMFASPTFTGLVTTPTATYTHYFRLPTNITSISTAQDFFGNTDAAVLDADSFYEIYYYLEFSKQTTNNSITFATITSTAPQLITSVVDAYYIGGGNVAITAANQGLNRSTATTNTVATTGVMSFSPEQNGHVRLRVFLRTNGSNGGNIRIQMSTTTGSCTALAGSFYSVVKHPSSNYGTFVV